MIARPTQHSLAAKSTAALTFALVAWGGVCSVGSSFTSELPTHEALAKQLSHLHATLPGVSQRRCNLDFSATTILETHLEEPRAAEVSHVAELPDVMPISIHCVEFRPHHGVRIILAPSPDHLIELPGTPPPSAV